MTCGNLICGFFVLLTDFHIGIILIIIGAIFDVFDGAVARWLHAQSEFGKQLDSLADLVTFGIAPAYLMSQLLPENFEFIAVFIVIAAALRLAKFNLSGDSTYWFQGLATPASALFFLGICIASYGEIEFSDYGLIISIIAISYLNMSSLKMFSFKGLKKDKLTAPFLAICFIVALIVSFFKPYLAVFAGTISYIILSVIYEFSVQKV